MPPVDYSTGSACCPRNYSALGDQRAEILPVQGPHTLPVSARRMMRLARILIFPFFSLSTRPPRSVDRSEHPPACALALAGCSPTANMIAAAADKALMDAIRWLFIVSRIMSFSYFEMNTLGCTLRANSYYSLLVPAHQAFMHRGRSIGYPYEILDVQIFVLPSASCSLPKSSGALRNSLRLCARSGANSGGFVGTE